MLLAQSEGVCFEALIRIPDYGIGFGHNLSLGVFQLSDGYPAQHGEGIVHGIRRLAGHGVIDGYFDVFGGGSERDRQGAFVNGLNKPAQLFRG